MTSEPSYAHAVIVVDEHKAQICRFDAESFAIKPMKASKHDTPQHNSDVRDVHEFFASVCDGVAGLDEVLVAGGHTGVNAFRHYVTKHRPALAPHIIGYEIVDHQTEGQLVAFARDFFGKYERLAQ